jgi:hypothetical protein
MIWFEVGSKKFAPDSSLEGNGFELLVRERGESGCRARLLWDGSARPFCRSTIAHRTSRRKVIEAL